MYHTNPNNSDTWNICCNPNIWTKWFYRSEMHQEDADGMANSVDPDQTAPLGSVWTDLSVQRYKNIMLIILK